MYRFGDLANVGKRANAELVNALVGSKDLSKIGKRALTEDM